jgi:anti-anti-sigma factor
MAALATRRERSGGLMKIQRTVLDEGVACLTLTGEFDSFSANPFLEQVELILQSGTVHVVANLRLVLFINSTAVGALIKARKRLRGTGGDLVLSEPSQRVRETLEMLGLGQIIKSFSNDEEAARQLRASASGDVAVPADNAVLLHFPDARLQKQFLATTGVAKMAKLEENSITFLAPGSLTMYLPGTELKVKFRLPLFRRAYYFDFPCTVRDSSKADDGIHVTAEFGSIHENDRRAIAQFLRDLRLLREEIRGAES